MLSDTVELLGLVFGVLLILGVLFLGLYRAGGGSNKEVSLTKAIELAGQGKESVVKMTPDLDMDLCEIYSLSFGCDGPDKGVEPYCELYGGNSYIIKVFWDGDGVCAKITEV